MALWSSGLQDGGVQGGPPTQSRGGARAPNLEPEKGASIYCHFRADNGTRDKNKKDEKEKKGEGGVFFIFHIFIYHEKPFY